MKHVELWNKANLDVGWENEEIFYLRNLTRAETKVWSDKKKEKIVKRENESNKNLIIKKPETCPLAHF